MDHVWFVDPLAKTLEVLALDGSSYRVSAVHTSKLKERHIGDGRHAFAAPSRKVGHEDVRLQMELWLVQNDPPTRTAFAAVKRRLYLASENRAGSRMARRGSGHCVEHPKHDLPHEMSG